MNGIEKDYEEYVKRYAECNHISVEEAKEHKLVKEYLEYLKSKI